MKPSDIVTPGESVGMNAHRAGNADYRPACMQRLGLLPPYSVEDVKRAYRALAKTSHPDAGGDARTFSRLHDAYEQALNLARFQESRIHWLAASVDRYLDRMKFEELLTQYGGRSVHQRPETYLTDYGPDFAQMLCGVASVHLTRCARADAALAQLVQHPILQEANLLDLSFSNVTDAALRLLADFPLLGLDLRGTRVTGAGLKHISRMPRLEWLHIGQTRVGLWRRFRWRQTHPEVEVVTKATAEQPDYDSLEYRQSQMMQRLATM